MKEATGELNMTVVTIIAIAAIGAVFIGVFWPSIRASIAANSACSSSNGGNNYEDSTDDGKIEIKCGDKSPGGQGTCQVKYAGRTTTRTCDDAESTEKSTP